MSQKTFIPGPWRVCEEKHDDGTLIIRGSGDLEVPPDLAVALIVGGAPDDYDRGTADLIASAPDLHAKVAALRKALDWINVRAKMEDGPFAEKIIEVATDALEGTDADKVTD